MTGYEIVRFWWVGGNGQVPPTGPHNFESHTTPLAGVCVNAFTLTTRPTVWLQRTSRADVRLLLPAPPVQREALSKKKFKLNNVQLRLGKTQCIRKSGNYFCTFLYFFLPFLIEPIRKVHSFSHKSTAFEK